MTSKDKGARTGERRGTVAGLFRNQADAEHAIRDLKDAGIPEDRIGVAMRDRHRERELAEGTGTQAGEGAAVGALSGGILGGIVGLLAGVGALAIPGLGPIIAGGALASALAGAGIGAAAGGLVGALIGMGIPEEDARHFEKGFQAGGVLVTADAGDRGTQVRDIFRTCGGDLGVTEGRGATASAPGTPAPGAFAAGQGLAEDPDLVLIREEIILEDDEELLGDVEPEPWRGSERRYHADPSYAGPERRLTRR
jgi:hypothetical protein